MPSLLILFFHKCKDLVVNSENFSSVPDLKIAICTAVHHTCRYCPFVYLYQKVTPEKKSVLVSSSVIDHLSSLLMLGVFPTLEN